MIIKNIEILRTGSIGLTDGKRVIIFSEGRSESDYENIMKEKRYGTEVC